MRGRVLMESEKQLIAEGYKTKTLRQLKKEFNLGDDRIREVLKEKHIPLRNRGESPKMPTPMNIEEPDKQLDKQFSDRLHDIKKEEITRPMPALSLSIDSIDANGKLYAPILKQVWQRTQTAPDLPSVINDLLEVMQYALYDRGENPGEIERVFALFESTVHSCVTLANDILFKPSELGSGFHYTEYTRLSVAGILIRQIEGAWEDDDILSQAIPDWRRRYIRQASTLIEVALEKTDREA